MLIETSVYLSNSQKDKLREAFQKQKECTLRIKPDGRPNVKLKLTQTQVNKIKKGHQITLSKTQLKQNGGFIGALLPIIAKGALAGLASLGAQKAAQKLVGRGGQLKGGSLMDTLLPHIARGVATGLAALGVHRVAKKVLTGKGNKKKGREFYRIGSCRV
jgi:hypothetical protein